MAKAPQKTGKTIRLGNEDWELEDPGIDASYVDLMIETMVSNGIVCVSLAQALFDGSSKRARLLSRLRMAPNVAIAAGELLMRMGKDAQNARQIPVSSTVKN